MTAALHKRHLKWFIAAGVALCALAYLAVAGVRSPAVAPLETATVMRGDLTLSIQTVGQLMTEKEVSVYPEVSGQATVTWIIPEGTSVKAGDVLARLATQEWQDRLTMQMLRFEQRANDVTQAAENLRMLESTNATGLAAKRLACDMARLEDEQYGVVLLTPDGVIDDAAYAREGCPECGDAYEAFRNALLDIRRAETDLERARTDLAGQDKLLEKGFISRSDLLTSQMAVREAERKLESARVAYDILVKYTYPQTRSQKEQALREAEAELRTAELEAAVRMRQAETTLSAVRLQYERTRKEVDRCRAEIDKRTIVAPVAGIVLYGSQDERHGRRGDMGAAGASVFRGGKMFTIPDLSSMIVDARVLEMDITKVAPGQEIIATFSAVAGLVVRGKVIKVSENVRSDDWMRGSRGGKTFALTLRLDETDPRLKPGMSCDVEVIFERVTDAVYVPVASVFSKGDRKVCYVVSGAEKTEREVQVGRSSDKYVEITGGLEPGWDVLVAQSSRSSNGANGR